MSPELSQGLRETIQFWESLRPKGCFYTYWSRGSFPAYSCQFLSIYLLAALGLSCDMWDLVPWSGIKLRPPALRAQGLGRWTTREAPSCFLIKAFLNTGIRHHFHLSFEELTPQNMWYFYMEKESAMVWMFIPGFLAFLINRNWSETRQELQARLLGSL